jgi:hypothetical protein
LRIKQDFIPDQSICTERGNVAQAHSGITQREYKSA